MLLTEVTVNLLSFTGICEFLAELNSLHILSPLTNLQSEVHSLPAKTTMQLLKH